MSKNPLFTEGLYFFSNMYDDTLLSDFYQKISSEIWSASVDSQKTMATRGPKSSGDFNFYRGSINDFIIDRKFNRDHGFDLSSWSMKLPGFKLPVWNERALYRTYLPDNRSFFTIPQQDFDINQNIFDRGISIQFGENHILNATFVMTMDRTVYLVLPFYDNSSSSLKPMETMWLPRDMNALNQYIAEHSTDENDSYTALWIIPVDHEMIVKISPTTDRTAPVPFQSSTKIAIADREFYLFGGTTFDTQAYNFTFVGPMKMKTKAEFDLENASSWDLYILNRGNGNIYYQIPATVEFIDQSDGDFKANVYFQYTEFVRDTIGVGSRFGNSGYYCYLVNRSNRRNVIKIPDSRMVNLYRPSEDGGNDTKDITPSVYNVSVYKYDTQKQNKTYRINTFDMEFSYFPAIIDLDSLDIDNREIEIDVTEYPPFITNQKFHNSIQRLSYSLGSGFARVVADGADVVEVGDPSFLQTYAPTAQLISTEDYWQSEYVNDFRGYYLDKILKMMESDPMLNRYYLEYAETIDPLVVTLTGTPKTLGFNINNTSMLNKPEFNGSNPVVMDTRDYRYNSLEEIIYFDEPHSFFSVYSNGEYVDVEVYIRGLHMTPTCQTFKDGVNYVFLPCSAVAKEILKYRNVYSQLATSRPMVLDVYPHSYPREVGSLKESRTIRLNTKYSLSFGGKSHRTIRPIDLFFYPTSSRTLQKNFFDHFDLELTVDRYSAEVDLAVLIDTETELPFDSENPAGVTISDGKVIFEFCLRKDQKLDSFLPVTHQIWPGASIKPSGEKVISLRDSIYDLVGKGIIEEREAYLLMCRSLPLDNIKIRLIDPEFEGVNVTFGLRNFGKTITFSGGVLVDDEFGEPFYTEEPDESLIEYELNSVYYQDDNLGAFEVEVDDFLTDPLNERKDGSIPWLLFRNGRCDPNSYFDVSSNRLGASAHITSNLLGTTEYPGSDLFEVVHIPYAVYGSLLEVSDNLRYMSPISLTQFRTIDRLWLDLNLRTYKPINSGLLLLDTVDNDGQMRLGGTGTFIYNYIGCRLTTPLNDSGDENAVYYKGDLDLAMNTSAVDPCFSMKHYSGLVITKGMNLNHESINKLILHPHKEEFIQMRISGDMSVPESERFTSIVLQDYGFRICGKFTWPMKIQKPNRDIGWEDSGLVGVKLRMLVCVKTEPPIGPTSDLSYDTIYAITDERTVYFSVDNGNIWRQAPYLTLPYEADWCTMAGGYDPLTDNEAMLIFNRNDQNCFCSLNNAFSWRQCLITSDPHFEETGWSQSAYGNGIFVILSDEHNYAASIRIEDIRYMRLRQEAWTFTEIEQCPVEPWGGIVFTGKGFLAVNRAGTRAYFSTDGISWSSFDPRNDMNRLDYLHGVSGECQVAVMSGGIGAPPIRRASKISGDGWGVEFPPDEKARDFIINIPGTPGDIDKSIRNYPSPYITGNSESILVTIMREFRRNS